MTLIYLLHIVVVLCILLLLHTINTLLDKLHLVRRQLDRVMDSRDSWRNIATLLKEKKP